jgi:hypothetical protein
MSAEVPMDSDDTKWVVVLEAACGIDDWSLHQMLEVLSDSQAVALHSPDRYAIKLEIAARAYADALFVASERWRSAHGAVRQPLSEVVRAEVVSQQEFERECQMASGDAALSLDDPAEAAERLLRAVN